jgi:signal transduction histidine kinase
MSLSSPGGSGELEGRLAGAGGTRILSIRVRHDGRTTIATLRDVTDSHYAARPAVPPAGESAGLLFVRVVRAVEQERARLAGEIHDGPVQSLAGLTIRLETVRDLLAAGRTGSADQVIASIRDQIAEEVESLRRFMIDLRPPALDRHGLREALEQQGTRFESQTGIRFVLETTGTGRLAAARELVAYRIVQEALVNVAKHSQATTVKVRLALEGSDRASLEVLDDGVGFVPSGTDGARTGHFGLVAMRERAEMVGAAVDIDSRPGRGTKVKARFGSRVAAACGLQAV